MIKFFEAPGGQIKKTSIKGYNYLFLFFVLHTVKPVTTKGFVRVRRVITVLYTKMKRAVFVVKATVVVALCAVLVRRMKVRTVLPRGGSNGRSAVHV